MKRLFRNTLIAIHTFCCLNGLFALITGYMIAAGADEVYHGILLKNLAQYALVVFLIGNVPTAFAWMFYDDFD